MLARAEPAALGPPLVSVLCVDWRSVESAMGHERRLGRCPRPVRLRTNSRPLIALPWMAETCQEPTHAGNKIAPANGLASLLHDLIGATEQRDRQPSVVAVLRLRTNPNLGPVLQGHHAASAGANPLHRCMKPSVSVCMKLTSAFSSSSESPSRPTNLVFMLSVDSGRGQHVVPSPGSLVAQRCRTSRVL
jgi:hypothetical protein